MGKQSKSFLELFGGKDMLGRFKSDDYSEDNHEDVETEFEFLIDIRKAKKLYMQIVYLEDTLDRYKESIKMMQSALASADPNML